jgi:hypothetical protein
MSITLPRRAAPSFAPRAPRSPLAAAPRAPPVRVASSSVASASVPLPARAPARLLAGSCAGLTACTALASRRRGVALAAVADGSGKMAGPSAPRFELPPLPYAKDALEPHTSGRTLEFHHGKHHAAYVTNLNAVLEKGGADAAARYGGMCLEDVVKTAYKAENGNGPVFNNAGQARALLLRAASVSQAKTAANQPPVVVC